MPEGTVHEGNLLEAVYPTSLPQIHYSSSHHSIALLENSPALICKGATGNLVGFQKIMAFVTAREGETFPPLHTLSKVNTFLLFSCFLYPQVLAGL